MFGIRSNLGIKVRKTKFKIGKGEYQNYREILEKRMSKQKVEILELRLHAAYAGTEL